VRVIPGDHGPPHVHVYRGDADIKIALLPVQLIEIRGRVSNADVRLARRIVAENRNACLRTFEEYGS